MIRESNGFFAVDSDLGGLSPDFTVAEGRSGEQALRERLIAILLAVAHRMAIEAPFLPDVVPDTLATAYPVVADELRVTIEEATWGKSGQDRIRVLTAACTHPAVEIALREHVTEFDGLLTHLQAQARQPGLGALSLPSACSPIAYAPHLRTANPPMTARACASDWPRTRSRGCLWVSNSTAGRRRRFVSFTRTPWTPAATARLGRSTWTGPDSRLGRGRAASDSTRQRDENGREYLDCIDNGIGMGRRDLSEVFARAGVRFAELPEFLEEKHQWDKLDPPVELLPNSRFGVGVLSYFMMADEISIDTCRLGRSGQPGERLHVSIAGPGSLFRIRALAPGRSPAPPFACT